MAGLLTQFPAPHPSPSFCAPAQQRSDDPTREGYELLLRDAQTHEERAAVAAVITCTVAADPPRGCASLDTIVDQLRSVYGLDQWESRYALASLDRRHVVRLIDECGEVWVSLRSLQVAEVMA